MARTSDLGWAMARGEQDESGNPQITIVEPESEDSPAKSMIIAGFDGLTSLRDLINDLLGDYETQSELAKNLPDGG